jgi:hypothetical protein
VEVSCEHGNESSVSTERSWFLDQLGDYLGLQKGSVPWRYLRKYVRYRESHWAYLVLAVLSLGLVESTDWVTDCRVFMAYNRALAA